MKTEDLPCPPDIELEESEECAVERISSQEEKNETSDEEEARVQKEVNDTMLAPSGNPLHVVIKLNVDDIDRLMKLGYSLVACEKALYFAPQGSYESALNYLEKHELDEKLNVPIKPIQRRQLSPEEAKKEAAELQKKIKEKIKAREAEEKRMEEKNRIESNRRMAETKAAVEETKRKVELQRISNEKKEKEEAAIEIRQGLINDYRERFGTDPPDDFFKKKTNNSEDAIKKQTISTSITTMYNDNLSNTEELRSCITILCKYLKNIITNPIELKFQKIKTSNKAYASKVSNIAGSETILTACGFRKENVDGEVYLVIDDPDLSMLSHAVKFLELILSRI